MYQARATMPEVAILTLHQVNLQEVIRLHHRANLQEVTPHHQRVSLPGAAVLPTVHLQEVRLQAAVLPIVHLQEVILPEAVLLPIVHLQEAAAILVVLQEEVIRGDLREVPQAVIQEAVLGAVAANLNF